jgi:exonuclease III
MSVSPDSIKFSNASYDTFDLWPKFSKDEFVNKVASLSFRIGSYLTDPICKSHEYFRRIYIVDSLNPDGYALSNLVRKVVLLVGIAAWGSLAIFTTLPGIGIKAFAATIQKNPYMYSQGNAAPKTLPTDKTFSLLSWNICCVSAGYAISDGGVLPWSFRIDKVLDKIIEKNADVNCLYEIFDVKTAIYISEKLKQHGYKHCYFNIGPKAVGVSSGILIASKYDIENPEFTAFPKETLVGRTKHAAKGVFAFDLKSEGKNFARVYSTHLQHSEAPEFPTPDEVQGRRKQMEIIIDKINAVKDRCIILTGDLNLDDNEYDNSFWKKYFQGGASFTDKTWGGDEFCAKMVGKKVSGPLNLDHTMIFNETASSIITTLVPTGFNSAVFKEGALSDHSGILSHIKI